MCMLVGGGGLHIINFNVVPPPSGEGKHTHYYFRRGSPLSVSSVRISEFDGQDPEIPDNPDMQTPKTRDISENPENPEI